MTYGTKSKIKMKSIAAFAAMTVCLQPLTGAMATDRCIHEKELKADQNRFIQTQMMVAALQCRSIDDGVMPKLYNQYVQANKRELLISEKHIISYLKRGKRGSFNLYLTEIANRVSLASIDTPDFCGKMLKAGDVALKGDKSINLLAVMPVSYQMPSELCHVKVDSMIAINHAESE